MLRSLVGSEMCIRDSINAEYGGPSSSSMAQGNILTPTLERLQAQAHPMQSEAEPGDPVLIGILRDTMQRWHHCHPMLSLQMPRKFPTTRRDCFKIPYSAMEKTDEIVSPEYRSSLRIVLQDRLPEIVQIALSHLFLNYLSPHAEMVQSHGRHLFMMKCYDLRRQLHCWFVPMGEVASLYEASSDNLKQGISYNDVALVQTYAVEGVLALHAETWGQLNPNKPIHGKHDYGECMWIGGTAFHYGWGDGKEEASVEFANLGIEKMPEVAKRKAKEREKRARRKANQKKKKADEKAENQQRMLEEEEAADAERRKGLIQVDEDFAAALKAMWPTKDK
eukprot:TRINITY_DN20638_c0_g1_i2.p1 TRINITY_DN20638_c0_g1~~TRINITY_DN20638_c0_g1_i2.p1  ORF type:complete len:350 (+),score=103.67 TRINITY_DN20638_c0_g1_i2:46-1050(+)